MRQGRKLFKNITLLPIIGLTATLWLTFSMATASNNLREVREETAPSSQMSPLSMITHVVAKGQQYKQWRTLLSTRVATEFPDEVILLNLEPPNHLLSGDDKPYCIKLVNVQAATHNQWQFRYLRDSTAVVALFGMGNYVAGRDVTVTVPVHLTAVNVPSVGDHTYTLQMRFVGDQAAAPSAQLEIQNARLVATTF
jgi:hypothetical protein